MVIGSYVLKGGGGVLPGPTFPSGGLAATFLVNIIDLVGSPTLTIAVETRNTEDTTWTSISSFSAITTTGVKSADMSPLKELVRLTYQTSATNAWEGVLLQVLAPSWRPYP